MTERDIKKPEEALLHGPSCYLKVKESMHIINASIKKMSSLEGKLEYKNINNVHIRKSE